MTGKKIIIKVAGMTHVVPCAGITFCKSDGSYVKVHKRQGNVLTICKSLTQLEAEISIPDIIRISQSTLVNVHCIVDVNHKDRSVSLVSGERLRYTIKNKELIALIEQGLNGRYPKVDHQ